MKIRLTSTSFLLPNNKNWKIIEDLKNIRFAKFGDISSTLTDNKKKFDFDIVLIFLPDLIDYFKPNKFDENFEKKKITNLLKLIEKRLKSNKSNLIICLSEFLFYNSINLSKNDFFTKKIKSFFKKLLYFQSKKFKNLYILDLDETFSEHGYKNCFDQRNFYLFRCRLSTSGIEVTAKNLKKIINRIKSTNKKVLLVDCDNTLWGGVLAEDGFENIQIGQDGLGSAFFDFQKAIKKIKESGILVVILSKNNREDVVKVLKEHHSMVLKYEDITAFKVNWKEKTENIKQLSKDLYLGLDSFVFWDDNPIEREKVKLNLNQVHVIEAGTDVSNWPKQLLEYEGFSKFITTKEDKLKTKQYKLREKFIENKSTFNSELNYLKSIKLKPALVKINSSTINRATQLCQKTNQFNLRTVRYNSEQILKLNKEDICFLVHLSDIYGDHGIVGLICLRIIDKKFIFLDTFLMSCRIIGRHVEAWILNEIKKIAKKKKISKILAEFIPTSKNQIAESFLKDHKFQKISKKQLKENIYGINKNFFNSEKSSFFIFDTNKKIPHIEIYDQYK